MCKKKLLSAAIGTALAMGAGISYAGDFAMTLPATEARTYAAEQFGVSGTQEIDETFTTTYTITPTKIDTNLYVTYTLDGATWQDNLSTEALQINAALPARSIVKDGAVDQNVVQFLIEANSENPLEQATNVLTFSFKLADVYPLADSGSEISLKIEIESAQSGRTADTTESLVVAKSNAAVDIIIEADPTPSVAIDVAQGSAVFVNGIDTTTVSLGTIEFAEETPAPLSVSGGTYSFAADSGTLTVLNGNFAASLTNNSVFIDVGGTANVFDDGTDLAPTTIDATSATWNFTAAQLSGLYKAGEKKFIIKADGTTAINENTDPPSATLMVKFETDRIESSSLKHIKRNGTVCTLYNIPNATAQDELNIRVTNNSATKTGIVLGSLWSKDGTAWFTNQTLIPELLPNATERLSAAMLGDILSTATGGAVTTWTSRAVLVLSSDLTDMEALLMLRNAGGGPLLNMSTGGSGNSCD